MNNTANKTNKFVSRVNPKAPDHSQRIYTISIPLSIDSLSELTLISLNNSKEKPALKSKILGQLSLSLEISAFNLSILSDIFCPIQPNLKSFVLNDTETYRDKPRIVILQFILTLVKNA